MKRYVGKIAWPLIKMSSGDFVRLEMWESGFVKVVPSKFATFDPQIAAHVCVFM